MTDDVYVLMCKDSPIQKEWKPKVGDKTNVTIIEGYTIEIINEAETDNHTIIRKRSDYVWLPRQEDWQELYQKHITQWATCYDLIDFEDEFDRIQNLPQRIDTMSEYNTILWCLFVHREVYRLEWSWEEKKWKKVRRTLGDMIR